MNVCVILCVHVCGCDVLLLLFSLHSTMCDMYDCITMVMKHKIMLTAGSMAGVGKTTLLFCYCFSDRLQIFA